MTRAEYVEALKVEREQLAHRPESPAQQRRLSEVDAVLDQFSDAPAKRSLETASVEPADVESVDVVDEPEVPAKGTKK